MANSPAKSKPHSTRQNSTPSTSALLIRELQLLRRELRLANAYRYKFLAGLLTGLGTVLGATVLVAILIFILTQLATIEVIKPFIENIVDIVQSTHR
jgi:diacylglycerol kinase